MSAERPWHPAFAIAARPIWMVPMALLAGGGGFLLYRAVADALERRKRSRWPAAAGRITRSKHHSSGEGWFAVVAFAYEAAGRKHEVEVQLNWRELDESSAKKLLERYPPGAALEVYWDPEEPERAVLERDVASTRRLAVLAGLGVLLLAAAAVLYLRVSALDRPD